ncbi:LysR family transcriptional regulator [Amycolatopsis sp. NPDC004169]|uniref:LysR family transcriptional regulator n=1 Tax=Amycolatopsis sp. NPDC004169 TaxID=3154453 RepID=UPI0033A2281F
MTRLGSSAAELDWINLLVFRAVAEELSFTRAATRLRMSVSSVSQRIRRLERSLGAQLLDRDSKSVALTAAGDTTLAAVLEIDAVWASAHRRLAAPAAADRPESYTVGTYRAVHEDMVPLLSAVAGDVPWRLRYYRACADGFADLRRGAVDFLVWETWYGPRVRPRLDLTGFGSADIVRDPVWAIFGAHHPLAGQPVVTWEELCRYDWLTPIDDQRELMVRIFADLSPVRPRLVHDVDDSVHMAGIHAFSTAVDIGPPSYRCEPGIVSRRLLGGPVSRYALSWRDDPAVAALAPTVLGLYRERYRRRVAENNPAHYAYMAKNPLLYPGIDLPGEGGFTPA